MKRLLLLTCSILLTGSLSLANDPEHQPIASVKEVIVTDAKGIIHNIDNPTFTAFKAILLAPWLLYENIRMLPYTIQVFKKGWRISKEVNGTANMIHALSQELGKEGYGTLHPETINKVIKLSVTANARRKEIEFLKQLKQDGHKLVLATNMDTRQFDVYQQKLSEINGLFDGFVTTPYNGDPNQLGAKNQPYQEIAPQHFVAAEKYPNSNYIKTVKALADKLSPQAKIILVKAKKEDIDAVNTQEQTALNITPMLFEKLETMFKK